MPSAKRWNDDSSDDDLSAGGGGSIQNLANAPPLPPSHHYAGEDVYTLPRSPAPERPISWMRHIGETNFGRSNSTAPVSVVPLPPPGSPRHRRLRSSDDATGHVSVNSERSFGSRRRRRRFMSDEPLGLSSALKTKNNSDGPNTTTTATSRERLWSADSASPSSTPTPSMMSRPHSSSCRNLFSIKSFPPGGNQGYDDDKDDDSSASGRKVSFHEVGDEARYTPSEMGMADLPEDSELNVDHLEDKLFDPDDAHQPSNDNVFSSLRIPNSLDDVSARSRNDSLDTSAAFSTAESRQDIGDDGESDSHDEDDKNERRRIRKLLACCFGDYNRRMAVFVADWAPCFLCVRMNKTNRNLLSRLNIVAGFFYLVQIGLAMYFVIVMLDPRIVDRTINAEEYKPSANVIINVWSPTSYLVLQWATCCVALLSTILTHRIIQNVDLQGSVRYLWVLLWMLPIELYCGIGLFDVENVTGLWVKSFWSDQAMAWFRFQLCQPRSTYNTLCAMPIFDDAVAEEQWCMENYKSTDCSEIRDEAVTKATSYIFWYFAANGIWIILTVFVGYLQVDTLHDIISRPLVHKSFESNIPMWLSLPTIGSALFGAGLSFAQSSVLNVASGSRGRSIGPMYILAASLFFLASILTWLSGRFSIFDVEQKWRKSVAILCFLTVSVSLVLVLLTIFVGSISFASSWINPSLTDAKTGEFACTFDRGRTCTNCQSASNQCPEWSSDDVNKVLRSQAKASAALAGIFLLYTARLVQFGLHLWKLNQSYQVGYV